MNTLATGLSIIDGYYYLLMFIFSWLPFRDVKILFVSQYRYFEEYNLQANTLIFICFCRSPAHHFIMYHLPYPPTPLLRL